MTIDEVFEATLLAAGITEQELLQESRRRPVVVVRQASWYVAHIHGVRPADMSRKFNRDHRTVASGILRAQTLYRSSEEFRKLADDIERLALVLVAPTPKLNGKYSAAVSV